jgi:hypothetical protein
MWDALPATAGPADDLLALDEALERFALSEALKAEHLRPGPADRRARQK